MAKQSLKQKETEVSTNEGVGKQIEKTLTVDDFSLPSPQELEAYKQINPDIVKFLLETASKEQSHRHDMDKERLELVKNIDKRSNTINILGMTFAFCSLLVMMGVAAYMLYLNHPWFASFFGGASLVAVISIFVNNGNNPNNKLDDNSFSEKTKPNAQ